LADIDYFKGFNDKYGHSAGDECLRMVACALQNTVSRAPDFVARYGGEEFAILLPETSRHGATIIAERLRKAVSNLKIPHEYSDISQYVTISMGVATTPLKKSVLPEIILKQADFALYQAKSTGRNRFVSAKNNELITTSDPCAHFLQLVWNINDECGNPTIDAEHKYLFGIFNDLPGAFIGKPSKDDCATILRAVLEEIQQHFYNEETILKQAQYPFLEEHRDSHRQLYIEANQLIDKFKSNEANLVDVFNFLAFEVVFQHVFIEDKKFFPYI
jgi:diguanylate cyclase (GGDEF)-like protein/hemerythrin-like metal-binding protein